MSLIIQEVIAQSSLTLVLSTFERQLCGLALQVLDFERNVGWQAFEEFNRDYFALRLALARYHEFKSMTIRELHKGAWVGENAGLARVLLDTESIGTVDKLSTRYPQSKQDVDVGVVYRNADGAAFDLVTALTLEGERDNTLLILHECKHTRKPVGENKRVVSALDVEAALEKAEHALHESGEEKRRYALIFITNRLFKSAKGYPMASELERANLTNSVVIGRENCIDYFGPSLARRFMGYSDPWEGEGGNEYLEPE